MCSAARRGGQSLGGCRCYKNEGGKSAQNAGRFWFVGAAFGGVSIKFHWRLSSFNSCPRRLPSRPLYATFAHILSLNCFLSSRILYIAQRRLGTLTKATPV